MRSCVQRRVTLASITFLAAASLMSIARAQHDHGAPAVASAQAGLVSFENSGSAVAQKDFLYGLAQLHNFQYEVAAAAFRRAQQVDPGFAMAYWGEAMTHNHPIWAQQDLKAARAVLQRLGSTAEARLSKAGSVREKAYLKTMDVLYGEGDKYARDRRYALSMERLHADYPDDIDATSFYALALLGTAHAGRDVPTYMRAAALTEEVFERFPQHPGAAHYLIHSVDDAAHAPLGLRAANAYSKIAPDSAHAQHMTSHIYLALGMWQETAAANEAAVRVAQNNIRAIDSSRPLPGCGHSHTWLAYAYLQQGRTKAAGRMVEQCAAQAKERPVMASGTDAFDYDESSAGSFHEMRSRHLIDSGEWRSAMAKFDVSASLPLAEYTRDFTDAYGAIRFGAATSAAPAIERAEKSATRLLSAMASSDLPAAHPKRSMPQIELDELRGLALLKQGEPAKALALLSKAAASERQLPMDFGPPSLHKPANELLGEVLLELGRAQEARIAFEHAQLIAPGRRQSLTGLANAATALKDTQLSEAMNAKLSHIKMSAAADTP